MKDAEIDSAERMKALQDLDSSRGMMSEIVHHAIVLRGSLDIIKTAASGKNAENADGLPDNFDGTAEDAMRIALDLIGAQLESGNSKKKKKKNDSDG